MVLGLVPGALHLVAVGAGRFLDNDRVGRKQLEQRAATARTGPFLLRLRALPLFLTAVLTGRTVISVSSCSERWW